MALNLFIHLSIYSRPLVVGTVVFPFPSALLCRTMPTFAKPCTLIQLTAVTYEQSKRQMSKENAETIASMAGHFVGACMSELKP